MFYTSMYKSFKNTRTKIILILKNINTYNNSNNYYNKNIIAKRNSYNYKLK